MAKRYVIMADGSMHRWEPGRQNPKHLCKIGNETLLKRIVRQIREQDPSAEIIITSHDLRYEVDGATRYEPRNNILEIDRFTWELINDNCCFLYGDTFYTDACMSHIVSEPEEDIVFWGDPEAIFAVQVRNADLFRAHITHVRSRYVNCELTDCRGWQVYEAYAETAGKNCFFLIRDGTKGFNTIAEYREFLDEQGYSAEHEVF